MFGFLFKVLVITALVATVGGYISVKQGIGIPKDLSSLSTLASQFDISKLGGILGVANVNIKDVKVEDVGKRLSDSLDALVTHPGRKSPVVLGVQVTNDSISTITDVLMKLPNDQLGQIKSALCASPSGN